MAMKFLSKSSETNYAVSVTDVVGLSIRGANDARNVCLVTLDTGHNYSYIQRSAATLWYYAGVRIGGCTERQLYLVAACDSLTHTCPAVFAASA